MIIRTEAELINFGREIGQNLHVPTVIELIGDVGAGKTTFTKGLAEGLGIKDPITSPSFTISKSYAFEKTEAQPSSRGYKLGHPAPWDAASAKRDAALSAPRKRVEIGFLNHYDFYRLPDPGLMQEDLSESINDENTVTVVEWAESVKDILPENHRIFNITLNEDGSRTIEELK